MIWKINSWKWNLQCSQWKKRTNHRKGTLYNKNNSIIYEVDFENDKYNGFGKLIEENDSYYIGQ